MHLYLQRYVWQLHDSEHLEGLVQPPGQEGGEQEYVNPGELVQRGAQVPRGRPAQRRLLGQLDTQ